MVGNKMKKKLTSKLILLPNSPVYYSNSIQIRMSSFDDVRLLLGQIEKIDENKITTHVFATLYMTRKHTQELIKALQLNLNQTK